MDSPLKAGAAKRAIGRVPTDCAIAVVFNVTVHHSSYLLITATPAFLPRLARSSAWLETWSWRHLFFRSASS